MAAIQTGSGNNFLPEAGGDAIPTSGHVGSGISELGMVENVRIAVELASRSLSVRKIFPLPVCMSATLRYRCRSTSGHVGNVMYETAVV